MYATTLSTPLIPLVQLTILVMVTLTQPTATTHLITERLPPYTCIEDSRGWCRFSSIRLLKSKHRFQPFAEKPDDEVRKVSFDDSVIPVFAGDVCDTFVNIEELWLDGVETEAIQGNAFRGCNKLRWLRMHNSRIDDLPTNIFHKNHNLRIIFIEENKIKRVNPKWFLGLIELEELTFAATLIDYFPISALQDAVKLKKLALYANNLFDLDDKLIVRQFPKLREIYYNKNELACKKVAEMNATFKASDVKVMTETWGTARLRYYNASTIDGIDCLDADTWATVLRNKLIEVYEEQPTGGDVMTSSSRSVMSARLTLATTSEDLEQSEDKCERKYTGLSLRSQRMQSLILEQQEFIKSLLLSNEEEPFEVCSKYNLLK